jgi:mRNA-degrading endonuclease RelE of RelBE toxin-antitoxin system
MKSQVTPAFRKLLRELPKEVRHQARAAYRQFERDPYHPSLQFKPVNSKKTLYSARIGKYYRAIGSREKDDLIVWGWIGTHADYDNLLKKR